jgi:lysozyme
MIETEEIIKTIVANEGFSSSVYKCTEGHDTIGHGFKISELYLPKEISLRLLRIKISEKMLQIKQIMPWYSELPKEAKIVVFDMVYQMGISGFLKFKKSIKHLKEHNFKKASLEILDSLWAKQTPNRANRNSKILYNIEEKLV